MTMQYLADATGFNRVFISNLEADQAKASPPTLRKLSKALGVSIAYLGNYEILPEDTLGQRIEKARLYHGLRKTELAQQIGVNPKTIRLWERDKRKPLKCYLDKLNTYLEILKTPMLFNIQDKQRINN